MWRRSCVSPGWLVDSDAEASAPAGVFLNGSTHPRAYGAFARVLGHYVRERQVISLGEAIRRLTSFPAQTLHLTDRGELRVGAFADIVVFDPQSIAAPATFESPFQYAVGVDHVVVNGWPVLEDGSHTGRFTGRVITGPGHAGRIETVVFETDQGEIEFKIMADKAPVTAANFLRYVAGGHYDGASFYRSARIDNQTIPGLRMEVVQGGLMGRSFRNDTDGGYDDAPALFDPIAHETTDQSGIMNDYGVISMARLAPGTATSEFFINMIDNPGLNTGDTSRNPDGMGYAAFGRVSKGMEVLKAIQAGPIEAEKPNKRFETQILDTPVVIRRAYVKN